MASQQDEQPPPIKGSSSDPINVTSDESPSPKGKCFGCDVQSGARCCWSLVLVNFSSLFFSCAGGCYWGERFLVRAFYASAWKGMYLVFLWSQSFMIFGSHLCKRLTMFCLICRFNQSAQPWPPLWHPPLVPPMKVCVIPKSKQIFWSVDVQVEWCLLFPFLQIHLLQWPPQISAQPPPWT